MAFPCCFRPRAAIYWLFVNICALRDGRLFKKVNVKMKTAGEMRMALIEKAGEDEDFRDRLLADPKSVIESEFDVAVPEGFTLNVHEESPAAAHIVLPPDPSLSTEQLAVAAGGIMMDNNDPNDDGY